MATIPSPAQALLGSDAVAHVWTSNPDGTGQISVVWVIVRDDDRSEVLLKPGSLDGSMFRFLRQGQRVRFDMSSDDAPVASNLRFGSDGY